MSNALGQDGGVLGMKNAYCLHQCLAISAAADEARAFRQTFHRNSDESLIVAFRFLTYNRGSMAASTVAAPATGRRRLGRIVFRSILILFVLVFLGIAGTLIYFYRVARASLPQRL
jgi:hypothetical protein